MKKLFILAAILTAGHIANASEFTGNVSNIRTQVSPLNASFVRVGIQVPGATGCSTSGWYSFELPDGATANAWMQTLTTAISNGRQVHIAGKGTCDGYGVESLYYIDLK